MKGTLLASTAVLLAAGGASAQPADAPQPIYRVTVVSRTLQAVNYEHRSGPTQIDFQGTVLLPKAKGDAWVESKRGRISVDAKFDHLEAPTRFGPEYLTYVLWAITPEGRPKNLGEIVVNGSNKAKISVTTDLQALGMIVTAEPYYSVSTPSDVVVLENVVRPDTMGRVEQVTARYDLLPRGQYTMNIQPNQLRSLGSDAGALPYDRYEALLELYQAQNAVQIARSLDADHYAPESFGKAERLYRQAQDMQARKYDTHSIISIAREAAQMAEDARTIAVKRRDEERLSGARRQELEESRARAKAEADAAREQAAAGQARAEADAARREADQARALAQQQAEAARSAYAARNYPPEPAPMRSTATQTTGSQRQARAEVYGQLNAVLTTRDTPRGLVATVPDFFFEHGALRPTVSDRIARVAAAVVAHPGLVVHVEGFADDLETSQRHAQIVRDALIADGVMPQQIVAAGYGKERPVASPSSAAGREQNRRVEIVVSGQPIGEMALWDRSYSLNR